MDDKGGCQQPWTLCRSPSPDSQGLAEGSPGHLPSGGTHPQPPALSALQVGGSHTQLPGFTMKPRTRTKAHVLGGLPAPPASPTARLSHRALLLGLGRRAREPPPPRRGPRLGPHPPSAQGLLPPPSPTRVRGRRARCEPPAATSPARIPQGRAPGRRRLGQDRPPLKGLGSLSHARPHRTSPAEQLWGEGRGSGHGSRFWTPARPAPTALSSKPRCPGAAFSLAVPHPRRGPGPPFWLLQCW